MDDYFTIMQTWNKVQSVAYIGLCTEGDPLQLWKSNKHWFNDKEEVIDSIKKYYGNHYKPDGAFNEISDLKQTDTVQKYLNNIDRRNVHANMTDYHLIIIILNGSTPVLRQGVTHYGDPHADPYK